MLVVAAVGLAVSRVRSLFIAVALAVPLIPALTDPSCYYYSVWVVTLVLSRVRPALAVTLLGVAGAGQLLGIGLKASDERFFALAALYVLSCLALLIPFLESPARSLRRLRAELSNRRRVSLNQG